MAVELQKLGYTNLHALDISQKMLNEAKKKNVYKRIICAPLNNQRIPEIETGEFDAMICGGTLLTGVVRSFALVEMVRMVRPGKLLWWSFGQRSQRCSHQISTICHLTTTVIFFFVPTDGTHIHSYFNFFTVAPLHNCCCCCCCCCSVLLLFLILYIKRGWRCISRVCLWGFSQIFQRLSNVMLQIFTRKQSNLPNTVRFPP